MKIIIEIPEKTNAHIRSDYGHGVKGLKIEDMEILVDAVYHGEPYHVRPRGEWRDYSDMGFAECPFCEHATTCNDDIEELHYCFFCGAELRKSGKAE